jgi:hypothetical protein
MRGFGFESLSRGLVMLLDECPVPVVLAPLAGGPSTPELAAAVSGAGGLGFLAAGYLSASELAARVARTRELTAQAFGVNVFVPQSAGDPEALQAYTRRLGSEAAKAGQRLGEPRADDDDWTAKLAVLAESPVPVVSFTFGCPPREVIARLRGSGSEVWVTVTSVAEARQAQSAGADALVVQGFEAGGHRGGFTDTDDATGLLALLQVIAHAVSLPMVAAGGIATGQGLAAVLAAGARAGALGSAGSGPGRGTRHTVDLLIRWACVGRSCLPVEEVVGRRPGDGPLSVAVVGGSDGASVDGAFGTSVICPGRRNGATGTAGGGVDAAGDRASGGCGASGAVAGSGVAAAATGPDGPVPAGRGAGHLPRR